MRVLRFLRRSPLLLLGAVLVAFGLWVAYDRTSPEVQTIRPLPPAGSPQSVTATAVGVADSGYDVVASPAGPQVVTHRLMAQLQPGMLRSEVEAVIGPPPAALVQPVTEVGGKFVYRTTYLANLDDSQPPPGVAPRRPLPPPPAPSVKTLIALEFDATQPGHPLIKVHPTAKTI